MKLKYITFTFENCDSITIDGKYVGDFLVDDIKTSVKRVAVNSISKLETAHTFAIEIYQEANKDRYQFEDANMPDLKQKVFDRFTWGDITSIEFELEESCVETGKQPKTEHYFYWVNWTGESDCINNSQNALVDGRGILYVTISEAENIETLF